jgi:hypothetical protein
MPGQKRQLAPIKSKVHLSQRGVIAVIAFRDLAELDHHNPWWLALKR